MSEKVHCRVDRLKFFVSYYLLRPYNLPQVVHYIPLYFYFAGLLLRYRELTFLYCNPRIWLSGILCESKYQTYKLFPDGDWQLKTLFVSVADSTTERMTSIKSFMRSENIDYPVMVKPDRGYGSIGVRLLKTEPELLKYLERAQVDLIVQEFCPFENELLLFFFKEGEEYRIHSAGHKTGSFVIGDGVRNLKELIADDSYLRFFLKSFLKRGELNFESVPVRQQKVLLNSVFKQSLGCSHVDCREKLPSAVKNWLADFMQEIPDYNFGRFDIKFRSWESLGEMQDFKILELNGGSAVATPKKKTGVLFLDNYLTIFSTWSLAFRIGEQNKSRCEIVGFFGFFRELYENRKEVRKIKAL